MDWSKLIEPRGNMVLVRRVPRSKTAGGLVLPDSVTNDMMSIDTALYEVLRCGPGAYNTVLGVRMDMNLEVGDLVLATAQAGAGTREVTEGSTICLLAESDVLCKVNLPLSHFRADDADDAPAAAPVKAGGPRRIIT